MFEGVKAFQKREGLPADGIARPGGTTEQMLNVALSERATPKSAAEREASRQAHRRDAARAPSLASPARRAGARRAGGRADDTGTGTRGTGTRGIGLRGTVGPRGTNAGADLATTRRALERAGLLDAHDVGRGPQAARPDEGLLDAVIRNVQRRHGLAQDGTITPGGPTDRRLARIVDADRIMHTVPRLDTGADEAEDAPAETGGGDSRGEAVFGNTQDRVAHISDFTLGNTADDQAEAARDRRDADQPDLNDPPLTAKPEPPPFLLRQIDRWLEEESGKTFEQLVVELADPPKESETSESNRIPHRLGSEAEVQARLQTVGRWARSKYLFLSDTFVDRGRFVGWDDAADALDLYLSATAHQTEYYHPTFILSFGDIADADVVNKEKFDNDWLRKESYAHQLITKLQDGETVTIKPRPSEDQDWTEGDPVWATSVNPEFWKELKYFAGNSHIESRGNFRATRVGETIHIEGVVTHTWKDRYDFNKTTFLPTGGPVIRSQMEELEKAGLAKPYEMRSRWHDRVSGTIEIRDGALQEPKMTWTRMPYETRIPWKTPRRAAAD